MRKLFSPKIEFFCWQNEFSFLEKILIFGENDKIQLHIFSNLGQTMQMRLNVWLNCGQAMSCTAVKCRSISMNFKLSFSEAETNDFWKFYRNKFKVKWKQKLRNCLHMSWKLLHQYANGLKFRLIRSFKLLPIPNCNFWNLI